MGHSHIRGQLQGSAYMLPGLGQVSGTKIINTEVDMHLWTSRALFQCLLIERIGPMEIPPLCEVKVGQRQEGVGAARVLVQ
jgi:hypothetical protein